MKHYESTAIRSAQWMMDHLPICDELQAIRYAQWALATCERNHGSHVVLTPDAVRLLLARATRPHD